MNIVIDPNKEIEKICNWIKRYFFKNASPKTYAVVGISGGKDSTVTAALLVRALGAERVIGVMMPCHYQADLEDAVQVCEYLGIRKITVDIGPATTALYKPLETSIYEFIKDSNGSFLSDENAQRITTNTPARIRMATLYGVAAAIGGRVANTCNKSEDFVGYSTKFGDSAGDFSLLSAFTVTEVKQIGRALGLPERFIEKPPADGLCNKTDEDNLGFTYETLDNFIRNQIYPDVKTYNNIMNRHQQNLHKIWNIPMYSEITLYDTDAKPGVETF
jgi:NAD+ synthase